MLGGGGKDSKFKFMLHGIQIYFIVLFVKEFNKILEGKFLKKFVGKIISSSVKVMIVLTKMEFFQKFIEDRIKGYINLHYLQYHPC